jgi:hypothetical protein
MRPVEPSQRWNSTSSTPASRRPSRLRGSAAVSLGLALLVTAPGLGQAAGRLDPGGGAQLRTSLAARGWTLREVHWDPILRQAWAIFGDPAHPERPTVAVPAEARDQQAAQGTAEARLRTVAAAMPVVHVGDRVRLWSVEKNLRLQLSAVAEENGAVGDSIRLSIAGAAWEGGTAGQQVVRGVVRGAAEVEMEP